jgi:GT2 family glycosyltransferase
VSAPAAGEAPLTDRLAVVVASRNRADLLARTLPRHLALPERPQVCVVDDASTDGTAAAVRAAHPQVRVVQLARNAGGAARNAGLEAVDVPYVALCDDDAWWEPGALATAVALLDRHPRLALVNAHILVGPTDREDPLCAEMARSPLPAADGQPGHPLLSFIACAVVVRREAVLAVGGFSPRLGIGGEEELLGWDLAGAGWLMSYVPQVLAHHDPPPSSGAARARARREVRVRNVLWTTWLRRPARAALARTVGELRRCPPDWTTVRGVARAVAGAPGIARERRVSPAHVEHMRRLLEDQQLRSPSRAYRR